jgi:hypothetical protein
MKDSQHSATGVFSARINNSPQTGYARMVYPIKMKQRSAKMEDYLVVGGEMGWRGKTA